MYLAHSPYKLGRQHPKHLNFESNTEMYVLFPLCNVRVDV
jgi:hypothetical protein